MKSEERHEMENNVLAQFLVDLGKKIGPYTTQMTYGLLAAVAIWAVWSIASRSLNARDQVGWNAFAEATMTREYDEEGLQAAAEQFDGKPAGMMAHCAWADLKLKRACFFFYTDKKQALSLLDEAEKAYQSISDQKPDATLRSRTQLGLAQTLEIRGEVDKAIESYQKVTGTYSQLADDRAKRLEELSSKDYAGWLAAADGEQRPFQSPGSRLPFRPEDLVLPGGAPGGSTAAQELDLLMKKYLDGPAEKDSNRYEEEDKKQEDNSPEPEADVPEADKPEASEPEASEPEASEPEAKASLDEATPEAPAESSEETSNP